MLNFLEELQTARSKNTEDRILELMDFASGFCNSILVIFE